MFENVLCTKDFCITIFCQFFFLEIPTYSLAAPSVCWKDIRFLDENSKTKEGIKIFCRILCLTVPKIWYGGPDPSVCWKSIVAGGEKRNSEIFAVKQRISMLGFPPIFCVIKSKKMGFRWKVFKPKYQLFCRFFVSQCQKLRSRTLRVCWKTDFR